MRIKTAFFVAVILIFSYSAGFAAPCAQAEAEPAKVTAKAAAVVEQSSGRVLFGKSENQKLPMASTTKIMTGLLAAESGRLDQTVTVPDEALCVEGTSMGLLPGEKITLRDLLCGLMLESGNDAANAIAIYLGGSVGGFVAKMNAKAQQLGLKDTNFVTPSGLDADGHCTTAADLARLGAAAMNNPVFAQVVSTQKIRVTYDGIANGRLLVNHNRLLSEADGVCGIKTGFTKKCGRCLVSCAKRGGVCIVVATLNDPDDWDDHKALLDYGFSLLKLQSLPGLPAKITENVVGGLSDTVPAGSADSVSAPLEDGEAAKLKIQLQAPRFVYAPVKKGDVIGEAVYTLSGNVVASVQIRAEKDVPAQPPKPPKKKWRFFSEIGAFFRNLFGFK